ncbi:hypothetical protein ACX0G7_11640 [Flavitalea antarctica]
MFHRLKALKQKIASSPTKKKWAAGATSGITVPGGNRAGKGGNQLNFPICVVIDKSGNLFVGDNYNYRVQKWAPGATTGATVAGGNGAGAAANQFSAVTDWE